MAGKHLGEVVIEKKLVYVGLLGGVFLAADGFLIAEVARYGELQLSLLTLFSEDGPGVVHGWFY